MADISKVKLPNDDTEYNIKDAIARSGLADKVDKETGKGLSTNDYTNAEKTKLAGIAEGAEVNVQADWTQTTTTADDYIKNKPTLGTAAAKNATDTYNSTGTDVTTGKAVAEALATLPEPMIFKGSLGTGGTISTLPTASSSNKGYVYKVISAGTYASQNAKVGDTFISDGSSWVLIPSGDEPSGTVTNVAVSGDKGISVTGSPVTSSGTITVKHSNSVAAKTTSSIKKITYDAQGHITGSSELSSAESNALASGINSTKVTQIETNKNNIIYAQQTGVKNIMDLSKYKELNPTIVVGDDLVFHGVTWSISNSNGLTVTGASDSSGSYPFIFSATLPIGTYYLSGGDTTCNLMYDLNNIDKGGGVTITVDDSTTQPIKIAGYVPPSTTISGSHNIKPMLRVVGDDSFEPYAMTNAELTAAIQAIQAQLNQ